MVTDLNIVNGKIVLENRIFDGGISIENGRIRAIAKSMKLPKAESTVDVSGNLVLPGLIDANVHLRDMNLSHKEDFYTGTCAAANGGFTTVLDMPSPVPTTNNPANLKEKMERARGRIIANVGFHASLPVCEEHFKELSEMGATSFHINFNNPMTEANVDNDERLLTSFIYAREARRPVSVAAFDRALIEGRRRMLGRDTSLRGFLDVYSPPVEISAVKRVLRLANRAKARMHLNYVSQFDSLELINRAKRDGLKVTCEVTPHHLLLSREDTLRLGGICLMLPVLTSQFNARKLWSGVSGRLVDVIASDHAPHTVEEKRASNVWDVSKGIPGLETTLPLLLKAVRNGRLSLFQLVRLLAKKPALIFNLGNRGTITPGFDADLTIVDLKREYKIDSSKFKSKARYSPFDGWAVKGKVVKTFIRGRLVVDDGEIVAKPGTGYILRSTFKVRKNRPD
ncbi:MAG: dihydroorotase family protein [Candidatus Bathyarchaeia archaeon]